MKFIRGIHNLNYQEKGCVLTIGNFDGVHYGHKILLSHLFFEGKKRNLPVIVMIFEPQPLEFFLKKAPYRLTNLKDKLNYLFQLNIDIVLCVSFNQKFSKMSAEDFIFYLLVKKLNIKLLIIGDDFRFGKDRKGNFFLLKIFGKKYGFEVISTKTFCKYGQRISSTFIRQALYENNFLLVKKLLGRNFSISGRIIYGDSIGKKIGFPTANLYSYYNVLPIKGVYIVQVLGIKKDPILGVANIGTRPTLNGKKKRIEIHLIDFCMNIYGYYVQIVLIKKIREEIKFCSLSELKNQIKKDILFTKNFFIQKKNNRYNI
ncbi:bifunctional riboflavin kinase/FAD synthetase [Candidatus Tachikawaea gelatinosa]|uniref:Riboflavin biosynthesis protein n=1 Tax=Candidatus Tachikawaea gelatinosa TaxID=1410383 RepID=A0A090BWL1_9ENTR|nr:bifunctional riboflavin kinase/FAD synthetase [Candidatus Tachikawaea gelatinosa]BAP58796.1 riboflavin biosynthesis protein [Candidatus Tachikawaea gelatinosa]